MNWSTFTAYDNATALSYALTERQRQLLLTSIAYSIENRWFWLDDETTYDTIAHEISEVINELAK